ncbi:hypothetical protein K402DRAFT_408748 [Aulographum hederae CBS 113979]|uniref:Uncharacterized protein n=1 Tax=Aulographum hederae CBS 113979 TaxID=1176131 RepID=A0A6G1GJM3_9PEZI|nr:hypothetical protein K402DRAFT_408748 [Aulographum hederae CBS 113979]
MISTTILSLIMASLTSASVLNPNPLLPRAAAVAGKVAAPPVPPSNLTSSNGFYTYAKDAAGVGQWTFQPLVDKKALTSAEISKGQSLGGDLTFDNKTLSEFYFEFKETVGKWEKFIQAVEEWRKKHQPGQNITTTVTAIPGYNSTTSVTGSATILAFPTAPSVSGIVTGPVSYPSGTGAGTGIGSILPVSSGHPNSPLFSNTTHFPFPTGGLSTGVFPTGSVSASGSVSIPGTGAAPSFITTTVFATGVSSVVSSIAPITTTGPKNSATKCIELGSKYKDDAAKKALSENEKKASEGLKKAMSGLTFGKNTVQAFIYNGVVQYMCNYDPVTVYPAIYDWAQSKLDTECGAKMGSFEQYQEPNSFLGRTFVGGAYCPGITFPA